MTKLSRRNFIKGSTLIPFISPAIAMARLSDYSSLNVDSKEAWVRKARREIPASQDSFFQTAGIGPSPKSVMNMVNKKLNYSE